MPHLLRTSFSRPKRGLTGLGLILPLLLGSFLVFAVQSWAQERGMKRVDSTAGPGRRMALVIGNWKYTSIPALTNPENDANDVAEALKRDGFAATDITQLTNLTQEKMRRAVRVFVESVRQNDFAFVYYSGHGVEVRGVNFLLPTDLARDASEGEVEDEAVSAQKILSDLELHGAAVRILVLDACRDNPLLTTRSASGGGLARMDEGLGTLVVFATGAGHTASDNRSERNGLFTKYLLDALGKPNVSFDDAVRDVARKMAADTNRTQIPAIYGLLERPVILMHTAPPAREMEIRGTWSGTWQGQTLDFGPPTACRWRLEMSDPGLRIDFADNATVQAGQVSFRYNEAPLPGQQFSCVSGIPRNSVFSLKMATYRLADNRIVVGFKTTPLGTNVDKTLVLTAEYVGEIDPQSATIRGELTVSRYLPDNERAWRWTVKAVVELTAPPANQ